jgi:orotidine-5'-phosphate decarboxylase
MPLRYGLILANDLTVPEQAMKVSKKVAPYVDGIKIGITTVLDSGVELIKGVKKETQKTIIADFKVADIGFWNSKQKSWDGTNAKIVGKVAEAGADYVICHSIVGISSIQECIEVAHSKGIKVLTLPYMTHKGAQLIFGHPLNLEYVTTVFKEYGISPPESKLKSCRTISHLLLILTDYLGVDGFIGPANNLEVLKDYREFTSKEIFGPGIGRQAVDDTPLKEQLSRFFKVCGERCAAIVGSAIYAASDPTKAAKDFSMLRNEVAH